jgi:tetraacyldisaccharide 4'-kinase
MGRPVWTAHHEPRGIVDLSGKPVDKVSALRGLRVLAVSSLGDPASFEATLQNAGASVVPCRFADHHRYSAEEIGAVQKRAAAEGLRLVTTAKDAVKLSCLAEGRDWWVLDIALAIDKADSFDQWVNRITNEN